MLLFFIDNYFQIRTNQKISVLNIFINERSLTAAIQFNYEWTLKDGAVVSFEVVDIVKFNEAMQITSLNIIYDTQQTREKFNMATL